MNDETPAALPAAGYLCNEKDMTLRFAAIILVSIALTTQARTQEIFCQEVQGTSCNDASCDARESNLKMNFTVDIGRNKFRRCITLFGKLDCFDMKVISIGPNPYLRHIVLANDNMISDQVVLSLGTNDNKFFQVALGKDGSSASRGICSVLK
ncbi:hypothetical protein [Methylobacterium sp. WL8]|uniref:hypothetical protein n=1 Tax=Methylobacterium sp. WL8 TaxID=2603899 RepID=UPI0011CBFCFB|nr:hypothetical protein [Methylobacterium sp. WL8]TXN81958.1 hypothetical protein FV234_11460 [Methylobacterium sp. WL8]